VLSGFRAGFFGSLTALPVPKAADGRIVLAVDVSPGLRPDAETSPDRAFCYTYGRGKNQHLMIPGWPYSFMAALESSRTSWTALLDAIRLAPAPGSPGAGARGGSGHGDRGDAAVPGLVEVHVGGLHTQLVGDRAARNEGEVSPANALRTARQQGECRALGRGDRRQG
jgi:hypothetical protein